VVPLEPGLADQRSLIDATNSDPHSPSGVGLSIRSCASQLGKQLSRSFPIAHRPR
jgi:hypothetical protein